MLLRFAGVGNSLIALVCFGSGRALSLVSPSPVHRVLPEFEFVAVQHNPIASDEVQATRYLIVRLLQVLGPLQGVINNPLQVQISSSASALTWMVPAQAGQSPSATY